MSHELVSADQRLAYIMPAWPSDVLRSRAFDEFFELYRGASFSIQTRDGWSWFSRSAKRPTFTAIFSSRKKLDSVIDVSTENALAKVFLTGDLVVQGDTTALLSVAEYALRYSGGLSPGLIQILSRISSRWYKALRGGRTNQWRALHCPLDLPVPFFQSWLGPSLGHSCARFYSSQDDLESAHHHGLATVCEQLELTGNDQLLDMSCGWGDLLLYAMDQHGAQGKGITVSERQAATTQDRIWRDHLGRQCTAECRDIGTRPPVTNSFQKIADIGLFSQVLLSHFDEYLKCAYKTLTPDGLLLLHRLTRCSTLTWNTSGTGGRETLNPGDLASLPDELQLAESAGFRLVSVEDLSSHLRQTLRMWIEQLQQSPESHATTEHRSYRTWLFHLLDTATNLDAGNVQLHHILLRRPEVTSNHQ